MMQVNELISKGFKRWQKNGMDRLYVNATVLGLDTECKTFQGKRVSNSHCRELAQAKTYIDLVKNEIRSDSCMLTAAVAELVGVDYRYGETIVKIEN